MENEHNSHQRDREEGLIEVTAASEKGASSELDQEVNSLLDEVAENIEQAKQVIDEHGDGEEANEVNADVIQNE